MGREERRNHTHSTGGSSPSGTGARSANRYLFVRLRRLFIRCLKSASKERLHAAGMFWLPRGKTESQVVREQRLSETVTSARLCFPIYLSISVLKRTGRWPAAEPTSNGRTGKVLDGLGSAPAGCASSARLAWPFVPLPPHPQLKERGRESVKCFRRLSGVFIFLPSGRQPSWNWLEGGPTHRRALRATCGLYLGSPRGKGLGAVGLCKGDGLSSPGGQTSVSGVFLPAGSRDDHRCRHWGQVHGFLSFYACFESHLLCEAFLASTPVPRPAQGSLDGALILLPCTGC